MTIDALKQNAMDARDELEYRQERASLNSRAARRRAVRRAAARLELAEGRLRYAQRLAGLPR